MTYVKNTSGKGPVSQFVLDNLSALDYNIVYRKGSKLVEADAVSRFPCLGPKTLAPDGMKEAFEVLLTSLPNTWQYPGRIWVYAQKETELIQQLVRQWMTLLPKTQPGRKVPYLDSPTSERIVKMDYSLALWAPEADKVKVIINEALRKDRPFACLIPSCLIHLVSENPEHERKIKEVKKIVLLQPELTWIIHKIKSINEHQVYSMVQERNSFHELKDLRGIIREHPNWDLKQWVPEQEKIIRQHPAI